MRPFVDTSNIREDGAILKARMDQDGYLFVRDLLAQGGPRSGAAAVATLWGVFQPFSSNLWLKTRKER